MSVAGSPTRYGYQLRAAGSNSCGQLGIGHVDDAHTWQACRASTRWQEGPAIDVFPPKGYEVIALESGASHTMAVVRQGKHVQVWGSGSGGQGALGDTVEQRLTFELLDWNAMLKEACSDVQSTDSWTIDRIACGWDCSFVTYKDRLGKRNDRMLALGTCNDFGQLGIGQDTSVTRSRITQIELSKPLKDVETQVDRGKLQWTVADLSAGLRHTLVACCAELVDEHGIVKEKFLAVLGWGASRQGQVLRTQESSEKKKSKSASTIWKPTVIAAWKAEPCDGGDGLIMLAAGKEHSIIFVSHSWLPIGHYHNRDARQVRLQNGVTFLFGSNKHGQLSIDGIETEKKADLSQQRLVGLQCTWNGTFALIATRRNDGLQLISAGNNDKGQLGDANADKTTTLSFELSDASLVCGSEHVLLASGGQLTGWGWNEHGNLALGDLDDRRMPTPLWPSEVPQSCDQRTFRAFAGCGTTFIQTTTT